jgi:hypothetical protein
MSTGRVSLSRPPSRFPSASSAQHRSSATTVDSGVQHAEGRSGLANHSLHLAVSDSGRGFTPGAHAAHALGLMSMRR